MKKFDQINVIPFIDIMLVLLAIVLTSASFISQGKIPVTPPHLAHHHRARRQHTRQPLDHHPAQRRTLS